MNVCILRNVMVMQSWNDQKVSSCIRAKAQCEWDELIIVAQQGPQLAKSIFVKLASKQLLQMLGLNAWGVGNVFRNATSCMEKNEDL